MSMKNSNDTIGNRTRDLPPWSAVPKPTAPPRAPIHPHTYPNLICVCALSVHSVSWLCMRCTPHSLETKSQRWAFLDIRNGGRSDKESACLRKTLMTSIDSSSPDKSGRWRNIRSFWGSSLNPCTNLWVGSLHWKGLNTIPRLLYLQMSPSDRFIIWWIPTAGLLHDEYFANITTGDVVRGVQFISLQLTVYSVHPLWKFWRLSCK
jgi:hypothetical protein